jgi:hypothetical protein
VPQTATKMMKSTASPTHRRCGGGDGGAGVLLGVALGFDFVCRWLLGGAFLAFLPGMMCGNDYSRGDSEGSRCLRMRGVCHDKQIAGRGC